MDEKDYALIPIGTEVSAKFKGAFCEAKIGKFNKCIKCKVVFDDDQSSSVISDENIRGALKVGGSVEARVSPTKPYRKATVNKVVDETLYTVVFNDGDQRSLKRNQLRIKGDKHFTESESLDSMPLGNPEEFGSPVVNSRNCNSDSNIGQIVLIEVDLKPSGLTVQCPCLVVAADASGKRARRDHLVVRSFMDNKYMIVSKKETKPYKSDSQVQDSSSSSSEDGESRRGGRGSANNKPQPKALLRALELASAYWENDTLPDGWNRQQLLEVEGDLSSSAKRGVTAAKDKEKEKEKPKEESEDEESSSSLSSFESSDEEGPPSEERDRFVAQLYRFMDERGTPLNKVPSLANKDLDLYRLYSIVQHCGGFNRVNRRDKWLSIYKRMHIPQSSTARQQIIRAYKKYLQPFEDCNRKLGSAMHAVDVWGRTRHASRGVFMPKPVSQTTPSAPSQPSNVKAATSDSRLNSSGGLSTPITNKPTPNSAQAKSPSSSQNLTSENKSGVSATPAGSSVLSSRRSSAIGESDSGISEKIPPNTVKNVPGNKDVATKRNRRESQSKDESAGELPDKRGRKSTGGLPLRGRPRNLPPSQRRVDGSDDDGSTSENEDAGSSPSGDDASGASTIEFSTSLSISVAEDAGWTNLKTPLPLETWVKVKCARGSVTASYEGKITAKKREADGEYRYHVHYKGWNSRYDEWIVAGRIGSILKIGDESAVLDANGVAVASSRASSVPNSVVSASESDIAGSNDEQKLGDEKPLNQVSSQVKLEESDKVGKEDLISASPPPSTFHENKDIESDKQLKSNPMSAINRKRKGEPELSLAPSSNKQNVSCEKTVSSEKQNVKDRDKDSASESGFTEKAAKTNLSVPPTRSTRSKPGEEHAMVMPNVSSGQTTRGQPNRRGGYRLKAKEEITAGEAQLEVGNDKNKFGGNGTAQLNALAALAATKSPSKAAAEHQRRLNRPNKFNFHLDNLDSCFSREERISLVMSKITEIRDIYGDLKAKVADIDKKRRAYRVFVSSNTKNPTAHSVTASATVTIKQDRSGDLSQTLVDSNSVAAMSRP